MAENLKVVGKAAARRCEAEATVQTGRRVCECLTVIILILSMGYHKRRVIFTRKCVNSRIITSPKPPIIQELIDGPTEMGHLFLLDFRQLKYHLSLHNQLNQLRL